MSYVPSQHKNYDMTEAAIDDRITALEAGVAALGNNPVVPAIPTANGNYELKISGESASKTGAWEKVLLPALPTAAGQYALKVEVSGSTKIYSWVDITPES